MTFYKEMKMSPYGITNQAEGLEQFGVHLRHMRKRPRMYFGAPPFLMPFHNFLLGYDIAEQCHSVDKSHTPTNGFREWLVANKGLEDTALGWPEMIEEFEPDEIKQLQVAIDWFSEYAEIRLVDQTPN